jgi:hypothetical protein
LKRRLKNLINVLRRPVEITARSGHHARRGEFGSVNCSKADGIVSVMEMSADSRTPPFSKSYTALAKEPSLSHNEATGLELSTV